ncbi:hypothetical protein EMN47_13955 [Prolixibacteraceae bacterium JC049]|nr:hypothetical protein [Prolixibacteraceae bacterium JC049]
MKQLLMAIALLGIVNLEAQEWPKFKHYDSNHLLNVALPLGGIGTGTVSLGGRGELRDWQVMNRPGMNFYTCQVGNEAPFFSIYVKPKSEKPNAKALLGPLHASEYMHYEGRPVNHHGMPRFSRASFDGVYPFGQVNLEDDLLPVSVKIKGFNPFIPGNADASSIPIAILKYEVTNNTNVAMDVAVCGTMRNFIGIDGSKTTKNWKGDIIPVGAKKNVNTFFKGDDVSGIYMTSDGVDAKDGAWGTFALTTPNAKNVTYRRSSTPNHWANAILDFWDDFSDDGLLVDKKKLVDDNPMASLAVKKTIAANSTQTFTFYMTWHFPNRKDWNDGWALNKNGKIIGNYYTEKYKNAKDVIETEVKQIPEYEKQTINFVNTFLNTSIPDVVKEAALFNLTSMRSQTVFRIPSGHVLGWEGIMDEVGSCYGSCTHVWNYETATSFLFGDLARTMRDVEFTYATNEKGHMMNRVKFPLESNKGNHVAAADGQMGTIMRFYRDWMLSGNIDFLKKHWPKVKLAMSYAWINGGWDGNQDGVQEGRQHNTMDVDYYGPNPQMQFWYFGALKASAEMAKVVGDKQFAKKCEKLLANGSEWVDNNLFNGEYYEHKITNPKNFDEFLDMSKPDVQVPWYQLGTGCLVDQLAGQYMAHVCGLGYLASEQNVKTALNSVMQKNFVDKFENVFNNMRSYVMDKESGLIMSSWPKGRLKIPFPYWAESMSGFEYTAAIGMLYEGQYENGLKCIKAIRDRYDGNKRNPFDEPECGHFYARAMASWSAPMAYSKFNYNGHEKTFAITSNPGTYFWSNGSAWGNVVVGKDEVTIHTEYGNLPIKYLIVGAQKPVKVKATNIKSGENFKIEL